MPYFGTNLNFVIFIVPSVLLRRGVPSSNSGAGLSFIVGSKSTQTSPGGFLMRSLAVWTRSLSSQEVNTVFLAGKKNFSEDVMFILKQRNCVAQYRTWDIQMYKLHRHPKNVSIILNGPIWKREMLPTRLQCINDDSSCGAVVPGFKYH